MLLSSHSLSQLVDLLQPFERRVGRAVRRLHAVGGEARASLAGQQQQVGRASKRATGQGGLMFERDGPLDASLMRESMQY